MLIRTIQKKKSEEDDERYSGEDNEVLNEKHNREKESK